MGSPSAAVNEHTDADRFAASTVKSSDHIPNAIPRGKDIVNDQGGLPGSDLESSTEMAVAVLLFSKGGSHSELPRYFIADDDAASCWPDNELDSYITETFCYEPTELFGLRWPLQNTELLQIYWRVSSRSKLKMAIKNGTSLV